MRVIFVVLLFIGLASCSSYYRNADGDNWNQRQESEESSGSAEISNAALADSGETAQNGVAEMTTMKPKLQFRTVKTLRPRTARPITRRTNTNKPGTAGPFTRRPKGPPGTARAITRRTKRPKMELFIRQTTAAPLAMSASSSEETDY